MRTNQYGELFANTTWGGFGPSRLFADDGSEEGGGAGGGEEGGEEDKSGAGKVAGSEGGEGDTGDKGKTGGDESEGPGKPEWLAEKFWQPKDLVEDGKINYERLAERSEHARAEAEKRLSTKWEDLKQEVKKEGEDFLPAGVPEKPDGYTLEIGKDIVPEGVHVEVSSEDPMLAYFQQIAHKNKMPQSEFNEVINKYVEMRVAELPDYDKEMDELGEHGELRTERVMAWASQSMSKESQASLAQFTVTAAAVTFMEEIMELAGNPALKIDEETGKYNESYSKDELKEMMNDERYWKNGGDPSYVAKVRAGFKRLAG